jgi:hypothetical protein
MIELVGMDKTIRLFSSVDAMKAEEYRYWQSVPAAVRAMAVSEITAAAYSIGGRGADVPRLQRTLVCIKQP